MSRVLYLGGVMTVNHYLSLSEVQNEVGCEIIQ